MFDVAKQLAVQSYCFRHFKTIDELIAQIKGIGLARVELCRAHLDFNDESLFEPAIEQFKKAGVQIGSIGMQRFKGDTVNEEKWFRFCKLSGAKMISVTFNLDSVPDAYKSAEAMAEKYDVLLGIHNHGGTDWLGNSVMLNNILQNTGPRMGLCIDSAMTLAVGEDPLKWAERFSERLYGTHVKDFIFDRARKAQDVVVGTGNLKLAEYMKLILKAPKMAAITLEYEGDVENPGPALRDCVNQIKAAVTSI
ncbi:MAG: sugar phosphate isomerase/epimerase [Phycisphaerales bacterium]|nr:sugar phosphate isomerase/epimerase [Phycisphaerales bacterium]